MYVCTCTHRYKYPHHMLLNVGSTPRECKRIHMQLNISMYVYEYVRACVHEHTLLGDSPAWFFPGSRHTLPLEVEGGQYPGEVTEHDMKRGKGHGTKYVRIHNHQRSTIHPT